MMMMMIYYFYRMDDDYDDDDYYDDEGPDFRLRDGLDVGKLQLGEAQEFEIDTDGTQNGKFCIDILLYHNHNFWHNV